MPDSASPAYDRAQVEAILRRAAMLQHHSAEPAEDEPAGLTIAELREAAAAAGIDPRFVDEAARAVSYDTGGEDREGALGPPATLDIRVSAEGAVDPATFPLLREHVRAVMGAAFDDTPRPPRSAASRTGSPERFTWSHGEAEQILVTPLEGRTEIEARGRWGGLRGLLLGGSAVAGGAAGLLVGALLWGSAGALLLLAAGAAAGLVTGRGVWSRRGRTLHARLRRAVDAAARHVAETTVAPRLVARAEAVREGRLTLPDEPLPEERVRPGRERERE